MRILTRKKQREIEKRLVANMIIADEIREGRAVEENLDFICKNTADIIFLVGGLKGIDRSLNMLEKHWEKLSSVGDKGTVISLKSKN